MPKSGKPVIWEQGLLVLLPLVTRMYQSRIVPQRTELSVQAILYGDRETDSIEQIGPACGCSR